MGPFLGVVAEKLMVVTLHSRRYQFRMALAQASQQSTWLPIQDGNGFASYAQKGQDKIRSRYIIVRMQAPIQRKATATSVFDIEDELDFSIWKILTKFLQRRYVFQVIAVGLLLNFPQAKLDDALEEIVVKTRPKSTPPGLCDHHPDLPCFHHFSRVRLAFQPRSPTTACLGTGHQIRTRLHTKKSLSFCLPCSRHHWPSNSHQKMPKKRRTLILPLATKHATRRDATVNIRSGANAYYAIRKLPTISSGSVSSKCIRRCLALCLRLCGYAPSMPYPWQSLRCCRSEHGSHANEGPAFTRPSSPPTANCTVAEFLRVVWDLGEQAEVGA